MVDGRAICALLEKGTAIFSYMTELSTSEALCRLRDESSNFKVEIFDFDLFWDDCTRERKKENSISFLDSIFRDFQALYFDDMLVCKVGYKLVVPHTQERWCVDNAFDRVEFLVNNLDVMVENAANLNQLVSDLHIFGFNK